MNKRVVFSYIKLILSATNAIVLMALTLFSFVFYNTYINSAVCAASLTSNTETSPSFKFEQLASFPSLKDIITDFFVKEKPVKKDNRIIMVYPGGFPLGFTMECVGVVVISIGDVLTESGMACPMENKNIKVGDVIHSINGEKITSSNQMQVLLNKSDELVTQLEIHRGAEVIKESVEKVKELSTNMYRLGLWIRDNAAGVGTLTYVRQDNYRFGALGHPVCDIDTGKIMPVSGGSIYKCNVVGYNKGLRGKPGELRGLFLKNGFRVGELDNNNNFGVYGKMGQEYVDSMNLKPLQVGFRDSVKTGKASILSTIDGNSPKEYEIEIIKLNYQSASDKKSMVIRVTDERLINSTGGIVQGMSGSPIIQNGKLVGAVTHVFVSDPTKGFGVYIDWMIDN